LVTLNGSNTGEKGTFDPFLKFEIIRVMIFRCPVQKLLWPRRNTAWPSRGPYGQL
jgi:hypothetical protein